MMMGCRRCLSVRLRDESLVREKWWAQFVPDECMDQINEAGDVSAAVKSDKQASPRQAE